MSNTNASFDIGRVFNGTFGSIKQNFRSFFLASLVIVAIPQFILGLWPLTLGLSGSNVSVDIDDMTGVIITVGLVSFLVVIVTQFVLQAAIIHSCIALFNLRRVSFRRSLSVAFKYLLPIIGFGLLATLGVMAGMMLFLIPGLILALMWCVGVPSMIAEGHGVMDSFRRSSDLTNGYKWWLFLLFIIYMVISIIINLIGGIFMVGFGGDVEDILVSGESVSAAYWVINAFATAIIQLFSIMISSAGVAAIYYELRYLKEGVGPDAIGAVFD